MGQNVPNSYELPEKDIFLQLNLFGHNFPNIKKKSGLPKSTPSLRDSQSQTLRITDTTNIP